jgi:hypothetical protein
MEHPVSADSEHEDVQQEQASRPTIHNIEIPTIPTDGLKNLSLKSASQTYGFRPKSGPGTPQIIQDEEVRENSSPIPDQYGLGWPGASSSPLSQ